MSGLEVAGLGIESYSKSLDNVKSIIRWKEELPQQIRRLRNQHVHYAQTMRILLEPIVDEFELAELLQQPNGQLWKGEVIARKLSERLGDSYEAYQHTIKDIERITKKIASKLDLDRAAELTRNDLEAMLVANPQRSNEGFRFGRRVRFGMSKKSIKALLEELDECNKELERFTDKSERIETIRGKVAKPSFASRLQRIQRYAFSLHETLSTCWSCTCQSMHNTSLQLDHRSDLYVSSSAKKLPQPPATRFKVSFSSGSEDTSHPWSWQAAEIVIEEEEDDDPSLLRPLTLSKVRKTVSFGDKPPPPYSVDDPTTAGARKPSLQEIKDLCASIQDFSKTTSCIGFSFDTKSILRGAYPIDDTFGGVQHAPSELFTLKQLLDQSLTITGRKFKLSMKERYSLALTLASSTLQLSSSPWFKDQWGAKDILFHQIENGSRLVDVERPYVPLKVQALPNGHPEKSFPNKNTALLALAVALLELYFGVSAEKHRDLEGQTAEPCNPYILFGMVYKWVEEEQENLSAAFSKAVSHCLRCFSDPSANLQDTEFLQAAVECIVLPLQEELHQFLGTAGL